MRGERPLGAVRRPDGSVSFRVWAPHAARVEVSVVGREKPSVPLLPEGDGYHAATVPGLGTGARYFYRLDGRLERPDPCSRHQPEGVHGPSELVEDRPSPRPLPGGLTLRDYVFYEVHTGAFTPEGTFEGIESRLPYLRDLGITAIELMPIAQFPGARNWGYDGVYPFAAQSSYGGPAGLWRLVDAAHAAGIAVVLDVVYNHLGPEGNYLRDFGPYFTRARRTPWGDALNFDGPHSSEVRRFFIDSALHWVRHFGIDALRVDAVNAIVDRSAWPFLTELAGRVHDLGRELGRDVYLIAESDINDNRVIGPASSGGHGFDARWKDDFHHALHAVMTGERQGYYGGFGSVRHLARALGSALTEEASAVAAGLQDGFPRPEQFLAFAQNHDQVGNRMLGERLISLTGFEGAKVAAGLTILSPFLPLLFMGEEYGEEAPFLYFVSHTDTGLVEAVRRGRRAEFRDFAWQGEPPDPQAEDTFQQSKLRWAEADHGRHRTLLAFYRRLLRLRRDLPGLRVTSLADRHVAFDEGTKSLAFLRESEYGQCYAAFNFSETAASSALRFPEGTWRLVLNSAAEEWGGTEIASLESPASDAPVLRPLSFVLYGRTL